MIIHLSDDEIHIAILEYAHRKSPMAEKDCKVKLRLTTNTVTGVHRAEVILTVKPK